jgi:hypothetical protein
MRELLLRVRAEGCDAPGQSGAPTKYFLGRRRRLFRRYPRFAIKYRLAKRRSRFGRRPSSLTAGSSDDSRVISDNRGG